MAKYYKYGMRLDLCLLLLYPLRWLSLLSWLSLTLLQVITIRRLLDRTADIHHLASSQPQIQVLTLPDTEMMWKLVDYNTTPKATPTEVTGDDQFNHEPLPDANIWFESFSDRFSETNIGDIVSLEGFSDSSPLLDLWEGDILSR